MKNNILTWVIIVLLICILITLIWFGISILANYQTENLSSYKEIDQNEDILNFSEAAVYINVSIDKLNWLVKNSKYKDGRGIPYYKMDDKVLFSKEALSKWIIYIAEYNYDY